MDSARIELATFALQRRRSPAELRAQDFRTEVDMKISVRSHVRASYRRTP